MSIPFKILYSTSGVSTLYTILTRDADGFYVIDTSGACQAAPPATWPSLVEDAVKKKQYSLIVDALNGGSYSGVVYNRLGGSQAPATDTAVGIISEEVFGNALVSSIVSLSPPGFQTIYGQVFQSGGTPAVGQLVEYSIAYDKTVTDGAFFQNNVETAVIDSSGYFQFSAPIGASVSITIPKSGPFKIIVTSDASKDLASYPDITEENS
jgi:hypothetical protein